MSDRVNNGAGLEGAGAGLYIHIPFCRRKCIYCAFYSVVRLENGSPDPFLYFDGPEVRLPITRTSRSVQNHTSDYLRALLLEAAQVAASWPGGAPRIDTLYVGGGTPSLLPVDFYVKLCNGLDRIFNLSTVCEATLEANPEHLEAGYLRDLYAYTPFRRLSIGVQSFFDDDLKFLNRKHTSQQAVEAVEAANRAGFGNISVDLMYGLHARREQSRWKENLARLAALNVPHFSAYALTVEPGTALEKMVDKGMAEVAGEELSAEEYFYLQEFAAAHGYRAYEISNYAKPGFESVHNSAYWSLKPYIGLGAAAHSFRRTDLPVRSCYTDRRSVLQNYTDRRSVLQNYTDRRSVLQNYTDRRSVLLSGGPCSYMRYWNISDVERYMQDPAGTKTGETLTEKDLYHEYIMTALRTDLGVQTAVIERFGTELQKEFYTKAQQQILCGNLEQRNGAYAVPKEKRFLTDGIALNFF